MGFSGDINVAGTRAEIFVDGLVHDESVAWLPCQLPLSTENPAQINDIRCHVAVNELETECWQPVAGINVVLEI